MPVTTRHKTTFHIVKSKCQGIARALNKKELNKTELAKLRNWFQSMANQAQKTMDAIDKVEKTKVLNEQPKELT